MQQEMFEQARAGVVFIRGCTARGCIDNFRRAHDSLLYVNSFRSAPAFAFISPRYSSQALEKPSASGSYASNKSDFN